MKPTIRFLFTLGILAITSSLAEAGGVLVVDAAGGGNFTIIQAAIDAASDGDTILVRPGVYFAQPVAISIQNKDLRIVADGSMPTEVYGAIRIQGLAADKRVLLSGLENSAETLAPDNQFKIENCQGKIWIQNCKVRGGNSQILQASSVIVVRSSFFAPDAGAGSPCCSNAYPGLFVQQSTVYLFNSEFQGANDPGAGASCGHGGAGCLAWSATVKTMGSVFRGGDGFASGSGGCVGQGGIGLELTHNSQVTIMDNEFHGGCGYLPGLCDPAYGIDQELGHPIVNIVTGVEKELLAPSIVRELQSIDLRIYGLPGDRVFLVSSSHGGGSQISGLQGFLALEQPFSGGRRDLGLIPSSGVLQTNIPVADALPPFAASELYLQAIVVSSSGLFKDLSVPQQVMILDQSL